MVYVKNLAALAAVVVSKIPNVVAMLPPVREALTTITTAGHVQNAHPCEMEIATALLGLVTAQLALTITVGMEVTA
jgi:hypothetical protein